jgi:hypothetical protein
VKPGSKSELLVRMLTENVQPRPGRGSWHGGPTPVGALRGVSVEQAVWAPATGRKSIWQLALHIAYWNYAVRRRLESGAAESDEGRAARFPRTPANWPKVPAVSGAGVADARAWRADVALLKAEHDRLVAAIAAVPAGRYGEPLPAGKGWTLGELILGIAQHDAYHTGQIQMLKRLWTARVPRVH